MNEHELARAGEATWGAPPSSRSAGPDPLVGQCLGGKLVIEERIGAGALGVVYRARHTHLLGRVAVKVLHDVFQADPTFRERFRAEAQAASALDHPSLVRVLDFGVEPQGTLWLAMELLDGVDLETKIAREGPLTAQAAAALMLQVCAGLAHAHARGVVHGDVKPSNVIVVERPDDDGELATRAKVCDFGIAHGPLVNGAVVPCAGTPGYMSPEQCLGEVLDARSDVYACGVLLFELVTGQPPFASGDPQEVLRQHLLVAPALPSQIRPGVPAALDEIVCRALAKDPADRFPSMREMRAALRALAGDRAPVSIPPPEPEPEPELAPRAAHTSQVREVGSADETWPPATPSQMEVVHFLATHDTARGRERAALATLLEEGEIDVIAARVARLLARSEATRGRDSAVESALSLLDDPSELAAVAERLLSEEVEASPYVEQLLGRAGRAAARALWSARVGSAWTSPRRIRFVTWLAFLGPAARDVQLAALTQLAPRGVRQLHAELAEDVLLSLPAARDARLAGAVEPFLASSHAGVARAARSVLGRLDGVCA